MKPGRRRPFRECIGFTSVQSSTFRRLCVWFSLVSVDLGATDFDEVQGGPMIGAQIVATTGKG